MWRKQNKRLQGSNYQYSMNFLGFLCLLLIVFSWFFPKPSTKVVFLDVGQGDAELLESGTRQVLIDGGPDMTVLSRLAEELPWFDKRIEVVIVTHPEKDHLEGLVRVLQRYEVGLVLLPEVAHSSTLQEQWLQEILDRHIPYRFARAGEQLKIDDKLSLTILNPQAAAVLSKSDSTNSASVAARANFLGLKFLFTGDLPSPAENKLLSSAVAPELRADILKVAHHGSKYSTSDAWLKAVQPKAAVIEVGAGNSYGHPNPDLLARLDGIKIWRTDENGTIRFWNDGTKWLARVSGH